MRINAAHLLIKLVRLQPILQLPVQGRHLLHGTLLRGDLRDLGLEPLRLGTGLDGAGVEEQDVVLPNIVMVVGGAGDALGGDKAAATVDTDQANRVGRELDATERTDRRKA